MDTGLNAALNAFIGAGIAGPVIYLQFRKIFQNDEKTQKLLGLQGLALNNLTLMIYALIEEINPEKAKSGIINEIKHNIEKTNAELENIQSN
jgi:hypothetical protein